MGTAAKKFVIDQCSSFVMLLGIFWSCKQPNFGSEIFGAGASSLISFN